MLGRFFLVLFLVGVIITSAIGLMGLKKKYDKQERNMHEITLVHKAIVQESDWLNIARPLTEKDLAGRIILLDFWTFCCINCMQVVPDLQYLEEKFGDILTVIGVHSAKFKNEKERDNIRSAIVRYNINHAVINDKNFVIWQSFDVHAWPTLILISPNGKIESAYSGEGHREDLARDINNIIKKYTSENKKINNIPLPIELEKNKEPDTILKFPGKLAFVQDYLGQQVLFISDAGHNRILGVRLDKKDNKNTGEIILEIGSGVIGLRDGNIEQAQFNAPQGLLYDNKNNILYVADTHNHVIRKIDLSEKKVITIAGTGRRGQAQVYKNHNALDISLASPWALAFFPSHDYIVVAGAGTHQLLTYNIREKTISTFVGNGSESIRDGILPDNTMAQPSGLSVSGDMLYCVDSETSSLRKIDMHGNITTLVGTGLFDFGYAQGPRGKGLLQHPLGVCALDQEIYIADSYNHAIRRFNTTTGILSNFSGNGKPGRTLGSIANTCYNEPNDIVYGMGKFYIADTNNHRILVLDPEQDSVFVLEIVVSQELKKVSRTRTVSQNLPNCIVQKPVMVITKKSIPVMVHVQENFKINPTAPSWLAFFKNGQMVQEYVPSEIMKNSIMLPKLEKEHEYRLQGTVYYCKDIEGSVCLLESYDQKIISRHDGRDNTDGTVETIDIFVGSKR